MKHIINNSGHEYWKNEKWQYHCIDGGPSIIFPDGSESWDENDYLHRENNPAHINTDGYEAWYKNGKQIK